MARLTRREKATVVGAGMLLGAAVSFIGQVLGLGVVVTAPLCLILSTGLGVFLASRKHGTW